MKVTIVSFGFLHGEPPAAHAVFDLREHFHDPHRATKGQKSFRALTGQDPEVRDAVLGTAGIPELIEAAVMTARAYACGPRAAEFDLTLAFGCAGGRHRAHVTATETARLLSAEGYDVTLIHRDVHHDSVERDGRGRRTAPPNLSGFDFRGGVGMVLGDVGEMTIIRGPRTGPGDRPTWPITD
ncbi:hypothetical protein [Kitasatospora sp. NPDC059160]|uniref:RapZ C-terminal domain-containing protein n=1 Tax=Kitasatospora sp. NPDC059160 TaxID=3346748 RepID=UPI0036B4C896